MRGLVARRDLLALGFPEGTIDSWVRSKRLHIVLPGVYAVGHTHLPEHGREAAAILAFAGERFLSHRTGLELWEMLPRRHDRMPEVTLVGRKRRGPKGVRVHFAQELGAEERALVHGLPVTSPIQSLVDFAASAPDREVASAYEEGLIRNLYTRDDVGAAINRYAGRRGVGKLRALYERDAPPTVTIGEAHRRLLELIRTSGLPHPESEVQIGRHRVDLLWRRERVIVEMDGAAFHSTPARLERDKRRDAELHAQGYVVIRVTWRQLTHEPNAVVARIAMTLARRSLVAATA